MINKFVLATLLATGCLVSAASGQAIRQLPRSPSGQHLLVEDFNNLGQVVGAYISGPRQTSPYMWDGAFHALPHLGEGGSAQGVNDQGVIVGYVMLAGGAQAARFTEETLVEFGPGYLTRINNSGEATDAQGRRTLNVFTGLSTEIGEGLVGIVDPFFINDAGHVAGYFRPSSGGPSTGFLRSFIDFGAGGVELGELPIAATRYDVYALGPNGEIAGVATASGGKGSPGIYQPFTWDSTNGMQMLPAGQTIRDINNLGDAVGYATSPVSGIHGAYWHNGQLINVNDLLAGTGWTVSLCLRINDVGQIVAEGSNPTLGQSGTIIIDLNLLGDNEPVAPTIEIAGGPFVYDGTPHEAIVSVTGANGEALTPSSITYSPGGSNPPVDAGSYAVSVNFDATPGHAAAYSTGTIVISPAPVLIAPTSISKALNAPNPPLEGSAAGFLPFDNIAVTYSTTATQSSGIGSYPITASLVDPDGRLSNYDVTIETATLSIVFAGNSGVLNPVNADDSSVFKQGSTVPVKIQVFDANGVSVGAAGTIVDFRIVAIITGTASETVNEAVASTTPDSAFRWTGSQWTFNVSTKPLLANRTYRFRITFADGSNTEFAFGLK